MGLGPEGIGHQLPGSVWARTPSPNGWFVLHRVVVPVESEQRYALGKAWSGERLGLTLLGTRRFRGQDRCQVGWATHSSSDKKTLGWTRRYAAVRARLRAGSGDSRCSGPRRASRLSSPHM